ncbi:MAG: 30S ribosomal protein S6, partial [Clostridiales bacterium]|nr:30S ribosomal protein S6 [Clostridiales bacterium]
RHAEAPDKGGAKTTSYPINYKPDAFFAVTTVVADENTPKELDRVAGLSANVLRRMITKVA